MLTDLVNRLGRAGLCARATIADTPGGDGDPARRSGRSHRAVAGRGTAARRVAVAGLVLVRQKPGSAKGIMFVTIEDETGVANLILWPAVFERQRRMALQAGLLVCHGRLQREGEVLHVIAERLDDLSDLLRSVGERGGPLEAKNGAAPDRRRVRHGHDPDPARGGSIKVPARDVR